MGRRSFLAQGAAAAAGVVLAGGAGDALVSGLAGAASPGKTNGPGRNGVTKAKPKRGGSLRFGTDTDEQGFNPTTAEWDEVGYMYGRTVFDPLFAVTTSGTVVPYLAESISHNSDYTSWTITLRPNLRFHDGTPCDGAALHTNLEKQSTSILTGAVFSQFVKDISQSGPLSVRIDMKNTWTTFPYYASSASQVGYVAAPSMLNSPDGGTTHPVGTGPFVFESWQPNDHFTAVRNTKYWRKGYPNLERITYKPIVDDNARSQALDSGTVDMIVTVTPQSIVQFRGDRQWSYVDNSGAVVGEPGIQFIQLNCAKAPFDDHDARLAMAKAYSQETISKTIGLNVTTPVDSPFVPGTPYFTKTSYPGYDPAGARKLVKEYERKTGKPFSFTLSYIPDPQVARTATYLQQRYQNVGMKCHLSVVQQNVLIENAVVGHYQAATWRQFGTVDPDLNYVFWSSNTINKSGISLNIARNDDPRIQKELDIGRSTTNRSARIKAYKAIGEYLAQDVPYTWLGRAVWAVVADPKVQNFNNPVAPGGQPLIGMSNGTIWPTQIWIK